jgi:uncharacterized repeat protein (TIGR01451 family)
MREESASFVASVRRNRGLTRKLLVSFAVSMTVFASVATVVMGKVARTASFPCTVSYSLTSSGSPLSWTSSSTPWSPSPPAGQYPGQAAGDCVTIGGGVQVTLTSGTASLADFTINTSTSFPTSVSVGSGGSLTETAGNFTNAATLKVDTGGTVAFSSATAQSVGGSVVINGGTVSINDSFLLFGQIQHKGGTLNGSGTLDVSGGVLTFDGSQGPMTVGIANPINVHGSGFASYTSTSPSNTLSLNSQVNVQGSSTFYANNDGAPLNGSGLIALATDTTGSFAGGAMNKTTGTSDSIINVPVNNDGTVSVTSSSGSPGIVLAGGGTHNGTFNTIGSSAITFSGTHNFNGGSVSASAKVTGAATIVNVAVAGGLSMQSLNWTGGTINGPNAINLSGASLFDTTSAPLTLNGTIQNKNALSITAGNNFNLGSSGLLEMSTTSGSLDLIGDVNIPSTTGTLQADSSTFIQSTDAVTNVTGASVGAFVKLAGGNLTPSGTQPLHLGGGGSEAVSSSVNFSGGQTVDFTGGTFTFNNPTPFGVSGNVLIDGGTLLFAGTSTGTTCSLAATTCITDAFELRSGQFSAVDLTLNSGMTWKGGQIGGSVGHSTVRIPSPQSLIANVLTSPPHLHDSTIELNGTMTLDPSANSPTIENASIININAGAILDVQGDGNVLVSSGGGVINNFGTFKKSGGVSSSRFDCIVNNAGIISSQSGAGGTIILNNGGTMTAGTLTTSLASDFIDVAGGVFTISGGQILGPGPTRTTISGEIDIAPSTIISANAFAMVNGFRGGTGELQIGTFQWSGGKMFGGGTTTLLGTALIDGTSGMTLTSHTLKTSAATVSYNPANPLDIITGGVFNNISGTIDLQNNTSINSSDASGQLINAPGQTIKKSSVGTTIINVPTNSSGILQSTINNGSIKLAANATQSIGGTIDLSPGTSSSITFANGVYNMSGTTVTGPGSVNLFNGGLNINSAESFPIFNLGGTGVTTVASPNQLNITSQFNFNGGTLTGNGATDVVATGTGLQIGSIGASLLTGGHTLHAHTATLYAASNANFLTIGPSSTFINESGFTFTVGGNSIIGGSSGTFSNAGTFSKSGSSTTRIDATFNHSGALNILGGAIVNLTGGGTSTGTINSSGFFDIGGGTYLFNAGTSTTIGGTLKITAGTLDSSVNLNLTNFGILGGTFTGSGNVTFSNAQWSGGVFKATSPSGVATLNGPGLMNIDGSAGAMTLDTRGLVNNGGTINYTSPSNGLSLINGATISNQASGTFDASGNAPITGGSFTNSATLKKSAGTSTNLPALTTNGTLSAQAGTMNFAGFTQTAGSTQLFGGGISVIAPAAMNLNAGSVVGSGTITAQTFNNSGASIAPGFSPMTGVITLAGAYSQNAGSVDVKLGGTTPGGQYDQVVVTGNANLTGGTLNATLINGFLPANGNTFNVFNFASKSGTDFTTKNLPSNWVPTATFNAAYLPAGTPTKLQLQAVVTSADISVAQSISSGQVYHNQNATFVVTVKNNGTSNATNVNLTNSISGGTLVSATPSQGTCTGSNCSLGGLAISASATVTVVLNATGPSPLQNAATASATEPDPNTGNNTFTVAATINPASDLAVSVTDSPDPVTAGSNVTYTITTTNNGPDPSGSSVVNISVAGGGTIVSLTGSATCTIGTPTSAQCTIAGITFPGSNTISLVVQAGATGPITASATSVYANDPNSANDTGTQATAVNPITVPDVAVTKSGPASVSSGGSITYNITVKNVGGAAATSVVLNDPLPSRLTNVSIGGACSAFPCNIGTLNAGQTVNVVVNADVTPAGPGTITNTASITATGDSNPSNNSSSVTTDIGCTSFVPLLSFPANGSANVPTSGTLQWTSTGAATYKVYLDVAGVGCTTNSAAGTTSAPQLAYGNLQPNTDYEWRVEGITPGCPTVVSTCGHFKTASNNGCATAPTLISPANNATVSSPVHFQWTAVTGASQYELFISNNGGASISAGTTSATSADLNVVDGPGTWFVVATVPNCGTLQSTARSFVACNLSTAPIVSVVAEALSGQSYAVQWDAVVGSTKYEIDEATNAAFTDATTQTITTTPNSNTLVSIGFTKTAQQSAQPFFYRVRAFSACGQAFGPYSITVRIVIAPLPSKNQTNPNVNIPAGSTQPVVQQIFIPGQGGTFNYTARADEPWLSITPPAGIFPPEGITLTLTADPSNLPNGTFTGTIIVTLAPLATGLAHTDVTPVISLPVSISLVTPVTPVSNNTPPAGALIIPSVGHLDGILSHWQSDIRVANAGFAKQTYSLTFTPEDSSKGTKTTQITIDSGATTALDDIVRNWYGVGQLGESAIGVLEIHPVTTSTGPKPEQTVGQTLTTVASSRTYNVAANGTLGQYVPAIPFASFIGKAAPNSLAQVLSLQQVAQSAAFRTNFGLVEAAGKPASVVLSVFDDSGKNLKDIPIELKAFEQQQLNQMLATYGITNLSDGRVEAKVVGGDGKITAYASVVDNGTQDPLLVNGVALNQVLSSKFVLPGVAALNNGFANWRTDMRIFNAGATAQDATLTMYPFTGTGSPIVRSTSINPGEVKVLDDVVQSLFGQSNLGGAVHVTTTTDSQLVVTGRTYDKTSTGTFGQFVPAVTPNDAVGLGARALQILQVEDSPRFRTNVAIAEVTGKPAKVEVSVVLPESRVTPILQLDLAGNEYRQDAIIQEMGLGNVYNARITVRVISGEGKITASGSVIDMTTQDPTYVPAQ